MRIVTAITGASGALYAQRFLQGLVAAGAEVHLVISPLGRRLRLRPAEDGAARESAAAPWHEIVGVVADFPAEPLSPEGTAASVYHAVDAAAVYPATLLVRMAGEPPASLAGRLADLTAAVDPALRPQETLPLDRVYGEGEQAFMRIGALTAALVTLSVLLLSAAGVYALMSFTLTRRRREIGIRAALGADRRRMLVSIFSRALRQVVAGVVLGVIAAAALFRGAGELTGGDGGWVLAVVALVMLAVGLLATLGPALRALRVEPTVALESEG